MTKKFILMWLYVALSYTPVRAEIGGKNIIKPSYDSLTGFCSNSSGLQWGLIKGNLITQTGFIFGQLERLDDFFFIFHHNDSVSLGNETLTTRSSMALYTRFDGGSSLEFIYLRGRTLFSCDFSKDPYLILK